MRYEDYPTIPDSKKIYSTFIDADAKSDFIVLTNGKSAALHLSTNNYKVKPVSFPYSISNIRKLYSDAAGAVYLFLSRSDKLAGLVKIFSGGSYKILNKITFDSYPSDFSYYKRGNKNYALVFGENFNGLKLLVLDESMIKSTNLIEKHLIGNAEFVDIDYDGLIDICCLDLIDNEIKILLNSRTGGFDLERTIGYDETLESYCIMDYNFDGFTDLVYNFGHSLEVSYGDSVSTFGETKKIMEFEDNTIEKIKLADFNRDGYFDVAVITGEDSSAFVKVAFSSEGDDLSVPVDYYNSYINDIDVAGYNPAKLAILTGNSIKVISPLTRLNKIKVSLNPSGLFYFGEGNDFFAYDSAAQYVNFIRNNFREIFPIKVSQYFNEMKYYKSDNNKILLYLYEKGKRSLEIIALNLDNGNSKSFLIYSKISVDNVIITSSQSPNNPKITIVSNKNNKLQLVESYFKDIRYLSSEPKTVAENVYCFSVSGNSIFYLQKNKNGMLGINSYNTVSGSRELISTSNISGEGNNFSLFSFLNKKNENIIILERKNILDVIYKGKSTKIDISFIKGGHKVFMAMDKQKVSYLYIWQENGELYKLGSLDNLRDNYKPLIISKNVRKDFFVDFLNNNNEIIYTLDKSEDLIKLIWKN